MAGYRMVNWGYCKKKHSRKWRCPVACGRKDSCTCKADCPLLLTVIAFIPNLTGDIRLYTPVLKGTDEYKKIYNNCTGSERVNNMILNDYHPHDMKIHSRKRYSFFAMIADTNIHLDARLKKCAWIQLLKLH